MQFLQSKANRKDRKWLLVLRCHFLCKLANYQGNFIWIGHIIHFKKILHYKICHVLDGGMAKQWVSIHASHPTGPGLFPLSAGKNLNTIFLSEFAVINLFGVSALVEDWKNVAILQFSIERKVVQLGKI